MLYSTGRSRVGNPVPAVRLSGQDCLVCTLYPAACPAVGQFRREQVEPGEEGCVRHRCAHRHGVEVDVDGSMQVMMGPFSPARGVPVECVDGGVVSMPVLFRPGMTTRRTHQRSSPGTTEQSSSSSGST